MNPIPLILAAAFAAPAVLQGRVSVRYWHEASARAPRPPLLGVYGADIRSALERAGLLYAVAMGCIAGVMAAGAFLPASTRGSNASFDAVSGTAVAIAALCLLGLFVSIFLMWTVVWYNKPVFAVPPHRRHDAGVRALRRQSKRK